MQQNFYQWFAVLLLCWSIASLAEARPKDNKLANDALKELSAFDKHFRVKRQQQFFYQYQWSNWSPCSVTCGRGGKQHRKRTRTCTLPNGNHCGSRIAQSETRICYAPLCPDINNCSSNPCLNGGTCRDVVNGFECDCAQDFTGNTCENRTVSFCNPNPCKNGATCTSGDGKAYCTCQAGYSGTFCSCATGVTGKFEHPTMCNLFIACVHGTETIMNCARKDTYYNVTVDQCLYSSQVDCSSRGGYNGGTSSWK